MPLERVPLVSWPGRRRRCHTRSRWQLCEFELAAATRLITDMRGVRYGEVLAVDLRDGGLEAEVYGTQMLNDCPQELWETLDAAAIAEEMGASAVKLNGPRHWTLDGLGPKVAVVEPVLRDFNGLTMRRIATVDLGDNPAPMPYVERYVNRGAVFFFDAGAPVYELVNPDASATSCRRTASGSTRR